MVPPNPYAGSPVLTCLLQPLLPAFHTQKMGNRRISSRVRVIPPMWTNFCILRRESNTLEFHVFHYSFSSFH